MLHLDQNSIFTDFVDIILGTPLVQTRSQMSQNSGGDEQYIPTFGRIAYTEILCLLYTCREYGPTLIIVIEMPRNKGVSSEDTMVSEEGPELPLQRLSKVLKLSSVKGVRKKFLKLIFSNVRSLYYLSKLVRLAVKR